jgi:hypothetical protein
MIEFDKKAPALAALVLLSVLGLLSVYQLLFDLWMTAYPYADERIWQGRLVIRVATTLVIATVWTALLVWFIKNLRSGRTNGQ